ncbi:MAG: SurA N-terminal domain-containing protein [Verrucomicrobiota bacterium]
MLNRLILILLFTLTHFGFSESRFYKIPIEGIAAIVNDQIIPFSSVRRMSETSERLLRESYEEKKIKSEELVEKIKETRIKSLQALIDRELIIQDFKSQHYSIPPEILDEQITEKIKNNFAGSRDDFIRTLNAEGMTVDDYREELTHNLIVSAMRERNVTRKTKDPEEGHKLQEEWIHGLREKAFIKTF